MGRRRSVGKDTVSQDIREVKKMLEALLRSDGLIAWVEGYVYGRTSQDDPFIVLYPAGEHLREKVCRVYPHQFKKLPNFIPTGDVPGDTDGNPSKDKAQRAGIYHECPRFKIVLHLGRETQMGREKRFSDVLYAPTAPAGNGSHGAASNGAPGRATGDRDVFDLTYGNGRDVADVSNTKETGAFFAYQRAHDGAPPQDRESLRSWWKAQKEGGD